MAKHQLKPHTIYCGDNLKMLQEVPDESVDLVYIDPPFNSNRNYEVFWGDAAEKRAFNDRFGDAQAYIDYMRPRAEQLYRVLKKTGSFYFHCDWHADSYVRLMLDEIFGANNFRNHIIWQRTNAHNDAKSQFGVVNDSIFYYAKSDKTSFNVQYTAYDEDYIKNFYRFDDNDGKGVYRMGDMSAPAGGGMAAINKKTGKSNGWYYYKGYEPPERGWRYSEETMKKLDEEGKIYFPIDKKGVPDFKKRLAFKRYLNEQKGQLISNVWTDIQNLQGASKEALGYPTQKPIALMERILEASSNKGDIVLDAFCGCGTTLVAAQKLDRKWIGIDISPTACRVMAQRLWDIFKLDEGKDFELSDLPHTEEELRQIPHFEFENWAVIALGGIPNKIKVGDYGIDGKLYPVDLVKQKKTGSDLFGDSDIYYPIQVKQKDKAGRPDIDAFETAIRRDGRRKGYFISFDYTSDAIKEIKRLDKDGEIEIVPITVKDLLRKESWGN
ncbi:MAG: restriction endonuclease [Bacteroidetes bacterium]|nr:restriction endonuclease [Bacteroidota bacterium]